MKPALPESVDEAISWLRKTFCPSAAEGVRVAYRIEFSSAENESIHLQIEEGRLEVTRGGRAAADVIFRISLTDFLAVLAGRENPDLLFMSDRLMIEGELSIALKLRKLFGAPA